MERCIGETDLIIKDFGKEECNVGKANFMSREVG